MKKAELRKQILSLVDALDPATVSQQSAGIVNQVLSANWYIQARRLSIYVSTAKEVDTQAIIRDAMSVGKTVFIPRFVKGAADMQMLRLPSIREFECLPSYLWGIRQPSQDADWDEYHRTGALDLVLLPGVAFTSTGSRLGHGKGFYDRFLADHRRRFGRLPRTVGIALRQQMVADLPMTETDVPVDQVINGALA